MYRLGLANTQDKSDHLLYRDVFWLDSDTFRNGSGLRQKMLDFVDKTEPFQHRPDLDLPTEYGAHLRQLMRLVERQGSKKMVERVARTDMIPRRSLLPPGFSSWFLYVTMGLYCLARLLIVAVGISSLRAIPEGVYQTTWAEYLPAM